MQASAGEYLASMDRRRLLMWLALFVPAITFGVWVALRPARRNPVDPQSIRVTVSVDGAVRVEAADGTDLAVGSFSGDAVGADATLERLRAQLRRLRSGAPTDPIGSSLLMLDIHGPSAAPWRWFRWIMQVASDSNVSIHQIQFRTLDDLREPVLLSTGRARKMQFDVLSWKGGCAVQFRLARREPSGERPAHTAIIVGLRERGTSDRPRMVPEAVIASIESGPAGLSSWLSQHASEVSGCEAQIGFEIEAGKAPSFEEIPFGEVVDVMNVLRTFGLQPLTGG